MRKSILIKAALSLFALLVFCDSLLAQQADGKVTSGLPPVDLTGSLFSMLKGLAICILALFAFIWVLKKIKSPIVTGQGRKLKIVERLPVTARSSLLLVEVNKKQILVGVGPDHVSLVSDYIDTELMEKFEGCVEKTTDDASQKDKEGGE